MKIAIVTGASYGLGWEFVKQIEKKYRGIEEIWGIARRADRLSALQKECKIPLRQLAMDLSEPEAFAELSRMLEKEKPDVKILINAAGYGKIGRFEEIQFADEMGMITLNCEALCKVTYLILPYISDNSRILQMASSAAFLPQPGFAVYAATKSFVLSFSRALNQELRAKNISVTAVCPGPVKTEFFDIAETTGKMAIYKLLVMADPGKVVRTALFDADCGKTVSVYGIKMKAFYLLSKILPHDWILPFFK